MIAKVLVEITNINVDKTFDYLIPSELINKVKIGIRVKVPFNNRNLEGFVIDISNLKEYEYELKEIQDIVDEEPILNEELMKLGKLMSKKYYATLMSCYQTMLPKALKAKNKCNINKKYIKTIKLNNDNLQNYKLNSSQKEIINILNNEGKVRKDKLTKISLSSLNTLLKKKIVIEELEEEYRLKDNIKTIDNKFILTPEQENAKKIILNYNDNNVFLLHGVTGSGKTLLYMEIVEEMLKLNKNSIFLVPEISLTPQMVIQFKSRFGNNVAVLHSGLSEGEKYDEYRKIKEQKVKIVVGARSAIFAPFNNLGVIIIDEEHTNTYKQESNPKYNAIEIAIIRAKIHNAKVILGSATPSLDSYARALKGVYKLVELKKRVNERKLPNVEIIDMNKEYKVSGMFSKKLIEELRKTIDNNNQAILLLNRRGYSSFVTCSNCGYAIKCPNCDITLTYHKSSNILRCHYCGYGEKYIEICPNCGETAMKNLGTGTEKVEEELNKILNAKIIRMDLDTTSTKGSHEKIINSFKNKEYDILLGTQMIAKGLDFENVTLVAVINSDTSLMIPNYRSSEYTFQLLMQTAGRSGRGLKEGNVIIQTFNPDHYAINLAKNHDYLSFFKQEMQIRRKLSYPPYYYLTLIKIIGINYDILSKESKKIGYFLKSKLKNVTILGPTTCSVFKLNNKYRFSIILKYKKEENLNEVIESLINHYRENKNVTIDIDNGPVSF
ncbi:MAG: primosomal protein N' [bacterium]|nr:primosomal protein N' [bacterium]